MTGAWSGHCRTVPTSGGVLEVLIRGEVDQLRRPVRYFHGGHVSATTAPASELYVDLGYAVVTVSRPGYGGTDVGRLSPAAFAQAFSSTCPTPAPNTGRLVAPRSSESPARHSSRPPVRTAESPRHTPRTTTPPSLVRAWRNCRPCPTCSGSDPPRAASAPSRVNSDCRRRDRVAQMRRIDPVQTLQIQPNLAREDVIHGHRLGHAHQRGRTQQRRPARTSAVRGGASLWTSTSKGGSRYLPVDRPATIVERNTLNLRIVVPNEAPRNWRSISELFDEVSACPWT
jgi:hypothetical protein